jgi:hypothetical protein
MDTKLALRRFEQAMQINVTQLLDKGDNKEIKKIEL